MPMALRVSRSRKKTDTWLPSSYTSFSSDMVSPQSYRPVQHREQYRKHEQNNEAEIQRRCGVSSGFNRPDFTDGLEVVHGSVFCS